MRVVLLAVLAPVAVTLADDRPASERAPDAAITRLFAAVRESTSGDRALETVRFMDQHWRWPGTPGFDASIEHVAAILRDAGYVDEANARPQDRLVYRLEQRPLPTEAWAPVSAALWIVGDEQPLLRWRTNRNMIAINSASTPPGGIEADLIDVGAAGRRDLAELDLEGRIVLGTAPVSRLFQVAVRAGGARGALSYRIPDYNRPETNRDSIPFSWATRQPADEGFGVMLSHAAYSTLRERLQRGPVRVRVEIQTRTFDAPELTLVAEVRGGREPNRRFVYTAHVQEPGANDNASGVAVQAEMARVLGRLVASGRCDPQRTVTFLWGDEISAIARYLAQDEARTADVGWGMSLDMVGADPAKTGGTFLIEKMPDPSAIWTRGEDRHTEWGAGRVSRDELVPHYFNDFVLARCLEQGAHSGWTVQTNPYEGGSDHVPFLRHGKPGLLLWHFTDAYYHTDGDRLENISAFTMHNAAVAALVTGLAICNADAALTLSVIDETRAAGIERLGRERELSRRAVRDGRASSDERPIVKAWIDWYVGAIESCVDLPPQQDVARVNEAIARATAEIQRVGDAILRELADETK
ncbi:MAG: M28 family peptidase [Planctomycetota bacterium]|jgi:hypothetical protein